MQNERGYKRVSTAKGVTNKNVVLTIAELLEAALAPEAWGSVFPWRRWSNSLSILLKFSCVLGVTMKL